MKLYLATSSLNIDNILSTESVAPISFYQRRTYGYNTFCGLDLTPFQKVLVLFSKIPHFEIFYRDHDSRPVVCEIEINEKVNPLTFIAEHEGIKVYSVNTIIRLSPFNTRLLFFNPKDLSHSQLSCSDSLTNKLGDRFKFDICRSEFDLSHLSSMNLHVDDVCPDFELKVTQDNRLNTIKGFIFGYYLGVSKSVSASSAKLLRIQKRIYDIAASIKNSGGYGTNSFYDELELLDKEYRLNDPSTRKCKELWEKTLKDLSIPSDSLNKLLETYDEKSVLKNTFMRKNGLQPPVSLRQYGFNNIEAYRDNLKIHTSNIIRNDQQKQLNCFFVDQVFDLDPSYETCMLSGEDQDSMVFNKFIDAILWHGLSPTPDTLRTDRFNIATQTTISAKGIWESFNWTWQESSAQTFMNELRQNIKSFTPLNIDKQENIILKSIAAFILKGEDFDSIVQFCEDHSYADYRYALALWGATLGYVKMSKPIINGLTKSQSFSSIYKAIISMLYNIECEGELPYIQEPITIVEIKQPETIPGSSSLNEDDKLHLWQEGIRSYLEQLRNGPKKKELYAPLESAFRENGNSMDYVKFFALLNDYKEWKTTKGEPIKAWKSMVEHFCPEEYSKKFGSKPEGVQENPKKQKNMGQKFLEFLGFSDEEDSNHTKVDSPANVSIINDPNAYSYISGFSGFGLYKNTIMVVFREFQRSYQSGYYFKNQQQYKRNNEDVVDHFCKWCLSQKNKDAIPWNPDNKRMMDQLKEYILIKYHD